MEVVELEPGKYRFQHFLDCSRDADNVVMARFERIGDADESFVLVKTLLLLLVMC